MSLNPEDKEVDELVEKMIFEQKAYFLTTMEKLSRQFLGFSDTLSPEILTKAYSNTVKLIKDNIEVTSS